MRISDSFRYTLFLSNVTKVGQQLDDINTKISTQKKINAPSDDPIKFATSIQYDTEQSISSQFNNSLQRLSTLVGMYDTSFTSVSSQLSQVAQAATDYSSMDSDLKQAAVEQINSIIEQLVTVGNTKLGNSYIFGGTQANSIPFRLNNDYSVTYMVDEKNEDATRINVDKGQTGQFGISGRQAFYSTKKIAFASVDNSYGGDIYSNTDSFAYVIDGSNNQIVMNGGSTITLASGTYTGGTLAKEIKSKLGSSYSVAFDSSTRKFLFTNNTGAAVTFNWSQAGSTAANTLGFDKIDSVVGTGETEKSDLDTGRKAFLVKITTGGSTTGALPSRATYQYSADGGVSWSADLTVNTGGADSTADITIDATNDTFLRNNVALKLTNGTYTGADLATEIETQLNAAQAGHVVSYDAATRKFTITNNTGNVETLNWSKTGATAAGVLGFDNVDSTLSSGTRDVSDYDAGMFIDGSGVVNTTNNRVKLLYSTGTEDNLVANDIFQVKDLSVFEMLKNLRDAFESNNATWVEKNKEYINDARGLTTQNNSIIAFQGTQANTLIENNKTNINKLQSMQSNLLNADMSELATQFTSLLNTYQALLSTLSKMQSVNILNYLS
jgi:flagellin-like hook-associated protein FlgL